MSGNGGVELLSVHKGTESTAERAAVTQPEPQVITAAITVGISKGFGERGSAHAVWENTSVVASGSTV